MLSVNHCGQLIPTKKSSFGETFGFLHTHHLFLNKIPNFYRFFRIQPFPNSISCLLQSIELNPQTVKDSLNNENPEQEEEVELYTVNYLKNACGLSEEEAIYAAKRLVVRNKRLSEKNRAANADVILAIFREHGLSPTQISMAVKRRPFILIARPHETILPKLDFLQSIGFKCGIALGEIISKDPQILATSLKNKLIPNYNIVKELLDSNHELIHASIKKSSKIIQEDLPRTLVPNVEVLRDAKVPKSKIDYLMVNYPNTCTENHSRFRQAVIRVKEMGFDPSRVNFLYGVITLSRKSQLVVWERSYEIFLEFGCSSDEIAWAFKKRPFCMLVSEEKIYRVVDCLVNKMGWPSSDILKKPHLFKFSLEKRIIPRCSVVLFLHSKGVLKKFPNLTSILEVSEDYYIKRYLTRFAKVVPEVLQIYKGDLNFLGK